MLNIFRVFSIIAIFAISVFPMDADDDEARQPARNDEYGGFNLPPKVVDMLRKEV